MEYLNINGIYFDTTPKIEPPPDAFGWRSLIPKNVSVSYDIEPTEHMRAIFQEYMADGRCEITIVPEHPHCRCYMPVIAPRRRYPRRNTRIQRVQAKRKAMDLSQDGLCCSFKTRRASVAYRKAEEAWIIGKRDDMPRTREFEHKPVRVRRREKTRALRWKPLNLSDSDREFIAQYSYDPLINPFGVTEQDLGELNNVNRP